LKFVASLVTMAHSSKVTGMQQLPTIQPYDGLWHEKPYDGLENSLKGYLEIVFKT